MLRGKQDASVRTFSVSESTTRDEAVIVVGPNLKIYQCGLPKEMALELFKPFVMKRLVETQKASNIKEAKKKVEKVNVEVWDARECYQRASRASQPCAYASPSVDPGV